MFRIDHPEDEHLVTIARFHSDTEFVLARMHLESAGIECFGLNENTVRIAGAFAGVLGVHEIEMQVRESDAEDALAILQTEAPLPADESSET